MQLKDILVHLDATERAMVRLGLAVDLARRQEAHLTALYVVDLALPAVALSADSLGGGAALAAMVEQIRRDALAQASRVETTFRERLRLDGVAAFDDCEAIAARRPIPREWQQARDGSVPSWRPAVALLGPMKARGGYPCGRSRGRRPITAKT
jgi:nucleotide-binding universal stress UspA family protein